MSIYKNNDTVSVAACHAFIVVYLSYLRAPLKRQAVNSPGSPG